MQMELSFGLPFEVEFRAPNLQWARRIVREENPSRDELVLAAEMLSKSKHEDDRLIGERIQKEAGK